MKKSLFPVLVALCLTVLQFSPRGYGADTNTGVIAVPESVVQTPTNKPEVPKIVTVPTADKPSQELTPGTFPTPNGLQPGIQFSFYQLIPMVLSPLIIAGLKQLMQNMPSTLLPIFCTLIGGLFDLALWKLGTINSPGAGLLAGAAGTNLRETIDQIRKAMRKPDEPVDPRINSQSDGPPAQKVLPP